MNKKVIILIFAFFIFNFSLVFAETPQPQTRWSCSNPQGQFDTEPQCEEGCTIKCTTFNTFTPLVQLPGLEKMPGESLLAKYLSWLFRFALAAAAFLAVLQITIGGIQMIFGGASETARTNAKQRIQDAIWGLVLALGSVLILFTISTQFKDMKLDIPPVTVTVTKAETADPHECFIFYAKITSQIGLGESYGLYDDLVKCMKGCEETWHKIYADIIGAWECRPKSATSAGGSSSCTYCHPGKSCDGCVNLSGTGVAVKGGGKTACEGGPAKCQVSPQVATNLEKLKANTSELSWYVSEGFPPTQNHSDPCHSNGKCVDVALTSDITCENVEKFIASAKNSGFTVANEYKGCGGTTYKYTKGDHLHIEI